MRIHFITYLIIIFWNQALGWGQTGHRVIGQIAEEHLTRKAKKNIAKTLGGENIAMTSNFMDEIRSDTTYYFLDPWHYCTIPDGKTYDEAGTPEDGDIISGIKKLISELESNNYTIGDEKFTLKLLIHLIGDIHQPLHVGNGTDRGGNNVRVEYFWENSNLHRVWDSGIIDRQKLSYTEYTHWIDHAKKRQIIEWQSSDVMKWAYESMSFRSQVYNLPESKKIDYRYNYENIELVNLRLLQAGIRLAGILNELYG